MCGEAHKGTLLIIRTVAQPLVVLGHVTEGPCDDNFQVSFSCVTSLGNTHWTIVYSVEPSTNEYTS